MLKKQMENLMAGQVVLDTRNNVELEIVGVGETKVILINGKEYSKSTLKRYFKLVEQQIPEVVEPDNTVLDDIEQADELTSEQQDTKEQDTTADTDTTATTATNTQVNEVHEHAEQTTKKHIVEGNTGTIRQNNLITDINNLMDLHDVQMEAKKEYIKVSMPGKRGALCMIRQTRYGTGIHIDFKSKILAKLDENYRGMLIEQYNCSIYDKTRGYYRVFDCSDLDVLRTIILTAKQVG